MKIKKIFQALIYLFVVTTALCGCNFFNNNNNDNKQDCDPDFDDCDDKKDEIKLESYKSTNYEFDKNSTNKNGSMSYEIFVRSFYDSNSDGIGDLNGINEKLEYLSDLGIKTIWLMPIHPSSTYHGYDVINYYDVNKDYGTILDFKELTKNASKYNIDVMLDMVFNHSSIQNPWFLKSFEDKTSGYSGEDSKADWYVWSDTQKSGFHKYGTSNLYYEGNFDASMPEFNFNNEDVKKEFVKILNYWIDLGAKGFRFDAVKYFDLNNTSKNVNYLTYLKENIKDKSVYFVGEMWDNIKLINEYYKSKCDSFFKFNASLNSSSDESLLAQVKGIRNSLNFASSIENQEKILKENNKVGYSSYFYANHDMDRAGESFADTSLAKMAANLLCLMPGTPFIYYGDEINLKGKRGTEGSDVMRRLPLIWAQKDKAGQCKFPQDDFKYLENNITQVSFGINDQLEMNYSLLNHYKKAINIRNKYSFIKDAEFINKTKSVSDKYKHVLIYELKNNDDSIVVIHNFEKNNVEFDVSSFGSTIVDELSVTKLIPELKDGKLKLGSLSSVIIK